MRWLACLLLTACARSPSPTATPPRCESCHVTEAREWEASRHRHSFDNEAFQASFAIERSAFCSNCHGQPEGIGCIGCHEDVHRPNRLAASDRCPKCHEFSFPGAVTREDGDMMQTTVREHASSVSAAAACSDCHRSHAFAEVRDPSWLGEHLAAKAVIERGRLRVTLRQTAPGHAFPTGDLFRRLEVGAEMRDGDGRVVRREVRYLARHWESGHAPGRPGRALVADDRVLDAPSEVDLGDAPAGGSAAWWVKFQRVAQVGSGLDPSAAAIESEVPLHSGVVR